MLRPQVSSSEPRFETDHSQTQDYILYGVCFPEYRARKFEFLATLSKRTFVYRCIPMCDKRRSKNAPLTMMPEKNKREQRNGRRSEGAVSDFHFRKGALCLRYADHHSGITSVKPEAEQWLPSLVEVNLQVESCHSRRSSTTMAEQPTMVCDH